MSKKRGQLTDFSCQHYVSRSALANVLRHARDDPRLGSACSRASQYRERKRLTGITTPYGSLVQELALPLKAGGNEVVGVQAPLAMFYHLVGTSKPFAKLIRETMAREPCSPASPWHLILYADEISPSNPLGTGPDHRKICGWYWSILELGPEVLCTEEVWMIAACIRSEVIARVDGGTGAVLRLLLDQFFFQEDGHHLSRSGIHLLDQDGDHMYVFAKMGVIIGDEPALAQLLSSKGHAGRKPCICCVNVYLDLERIPADGVHLSSLDFARMIQHTDASVLAVMKRLADAKPHMGAGEFIELERMHGRTYSANSLMYSTAVVPMKPATWIMFDWMHVYCVGGILNSEMWMVLGALRDEGLDLQMLDDYVEQWTSPRISVVDLFCKKSVASHKKHGYVSGTASQLLTAYPIIARWVNTVVADTPVGLACAREIQSFNALCTVVDLLQNVTRGGVEAALLDVSIQEHLAKSRAVYGVDIWTWKWHASAHLPQMLLQHGTLLSCWTHERRHKVAKRYMKDRKNLKSYERSVIEDVTLKQMYDLDTEWRKQGLVDPKKPSRKMLDGITSLMNVPVHASVQCSRVVAVRACQITKGDVALANAQSDWPEHTRFRGKACVEIWFSFSVNEAIYSVVSLAAHDRDSGDAVDCHLCDDVRLVHSRELLRPLTFARKGDSITALLPLVYR